ncbi:MAG: NUDIX domain-containing protein [Rhodobacteraceae bacterium]|nr:NUDIX domain-containing protein [Paracoccaceae bacterium]
MIRRFGEPPSKDRTYTRRPGAYALLPLDGKLLLTCQYDPDPDVQLPGGGIDPGESPIPALHREVMEETGWKIACPRHFGTFRRFVYMPEYDLWAEKVCQVFVAQPLIKVGAPAEAGHEALWMGAQDAARSLLNPGDRYFAARLSELL